MKHHCPQHWEMRSDEETKEFSLHSPPRKIAMHAPPANIIPNDVEGQE
jgi:hypothetical protein